MANLDSGNGTLVTKKYKKIIPVGKKSYGDLLSFRHRPEYGAFFTDLIHKER